MSFNEVRKHVQESGENIEGYRGKVTGDLEVALGELEAKQAQLMAELETIGGENAKWYAARTELTREAHGLRGGLRKISRRVHE
jgi:hypothetical protein